MLDLLQLGLPIPDALRAVVLGLLATGVIESVGGRGKGIRYMLARGAYVALGQKGAYSRMRGLDRNTNKELLVQHMRDNPAASRMEEFLQVLPSLSRSQVQVLLRELRADDRAHVIGLKKGARWHFGHRPADLQPA